MLAFTLSLLFAAATPSDVAEAKRVAWAEMPPEVEAEYFNPGVSLERGHKARMRRIADRDEHVKESFIAWARKLAYPVPGFVDHVWEEELFFHRDPETVEKFVRMTFEGGDMRYRRLLHVSFNPDVLAAIGEYLVDERSMPGTMGANYTKQEAAAGEIPSLIVDCEELPEDVRLWGRQLRGMGVPLETSVAILQRWWNENSAALRSSNWEKVQPSVLEIKGMRRSVLADPPDFSHPAVEGQNEPAAEGPPEPRMSAPLIVSNIPREEKTEPGSAQSGAGGWAAWLLPALLCIWSAGWLWRRRKA